MKYTILRNNLTASEYSDIVDTYRVRRQSFPYIAALKTLQDNGETRVSNLALSKAVGVSSMAAGKETTKLERFGLIENKSAHPLWSDWKLTDKGEALYGEFIDAVEFPEKLSNEV